MSLEPGRNSYGELEPKRETERDEDKEMRRQERV